jgi:HEAT repeat protein
MYFTNHNPYLVFASAHYACGTIASICDEKYLRDISPQVTDVLARGLGDNWSQVRYAASVATRIYVQNAKTFLHEYHAKLLPAMCLNRYYVAKGVRLYSIDTWRHCIGTEGRNLVAQYIKEFVTYYCSQSGADNHAVREAACQCIAELGLKIDADAVRPHVATLLRALLDCFRDDSWPVRDAACTACGNFVHSFPEECRSSMSQLFHLWFEHLADNIPSVRQGAAVALGSVMEVYGDEALQAVLPQLRDTLAKARDQPSDSKRYTELTNTTTFGVAAKRIRDNDAHLHSNQAMFSCGSLAPKMKRGAGCMDHGYSRTPEPWESSDGALYLLVQLARVHGTVAIEFLPTVVEIVSVIDVWCGFGVACLH